MHRYVHKWNIIDLAWTRVDAPDDDKEKRNRLFRIQQENYQCFYFYWGLGF